LAESLLKGELEPSSEVFVRWDECALCRRCEWVCPNGVNYKEVITNVKALKEDPLTDRALKALEFMNTGAGKFAIKVLGLLALPLPSSVKLPLPTGGVKAFPKPKADAFSLRGKTFSPEGKPKKRLLFFTGCMIDAFYTKTGKSVVKVLNALGYEVVVPEKVNCCGAPHLYHGRKKLFERLKEHNLKEIERYDFDALVVACPTCGGALREDYGKDWQVYSFAELVAKERTSFKGKGEKVTVHVPCHYYAAFKKSPSHFYKALGKVKEAKTVKAKEAQSCCGFAGLFSIKNPQLSEAIQKKKMEDFKETGAEYLLTECPGCVLQLAEGTEKFKTGQKALHLADYLAERL